MTDLVLEAVDLLRRAGVKLERGLSELELTHIEDSLGFTFCPEHRRFLATALPSGHGWPDWRLGSTEMLRADLDRVTEGVVCHVEGGFWHPLWGKRPCRLDVAESRAWQQLVKLPTLVRLYGNRYMSSGSTAEPSPVFSAHETDVIYYGDNLLDYVAIEFDGRPWHVSMPPNRVPFWSDIAEGMFDPDRPFQDPLG
ncbi:hypothetical protein [Nocardioides sp. Root140]|uniref:hypothetical protein n=1 Tax=Nocardioides sp. Root140 TaxID=1736460 RepID=UPI0006FD5D4F|nr:hypothetical protein [Nocardioides sp. Root140]KQY62390.1 hypothetical protein ASD30_23735 [Nocardioides sp. Root140]